MTAPTARARLATRATAAGYPPDLLTEIAAATFRAYQPGQTLTDAQIKQLTVAVDVLTAAGHSTESTRKLIARHRQHGGERWRDELWTHAVGEANARHAQPASAQF